MAPAAVFYFAPRAQAAALSMKIEVRAWARFSDEFSASFWPDGEVLVQKPRRSSYVSLARSGAPRCCRFRGRSVVRLQRLSPGRSPSGKCELSLEHQNSCSDVRIGYRSIRKRCVDVTRRYLCDAERFENGGCPCATRCFADCRATGGYSGDRGRPRFRFNQSDYQSRVDHCTGGSPDRQGAQTVAQRCRIPLDSANIGV